MIRVLCVLIGENPLQTLIQTRCQMKVLNAVVHMVTLGVLMAIAGTTAAQQAYPSKPIRFITPFPPGGGTTVVARLVAQKLTESWGQPVIVENRPGGDTIIGADAVAKAAPDGYTILLASSTLVTINLLHREVPFDAIKDFAPVATLTSGEELLVLHPAVPANTLQEFIALAKSKPGQLNYSSAGNGTTNHLAGELFCILAGVKIQHIPYKGGGQALTDLIGGQVQMFMNNPLTLLPHAKSGKIKPIAISGETRLAALPQVSTFTEAGLPGFDVRFWYGVVAPAATPKRIIDKLSAEIGRILATTDFKEKLASQGFDPFFSTPEKMAAVMKAEFAKNANVIKIANIKMEN